MRILKNCFFVSYVKFILNYLKYILNISFLMWLLCKLVNFLIYLFLLKVYVYYLSGKKIVLIILEVYRSICWIIVGGNNVERIIVNNFCLFYFEEVINGVVKMIKKEVFVFCKRGLGFIF